LYGCGCHIQATAEIEGLAALASQDAEKVVYFVIPSEVRNLSWIETR
jgi:hypothetical protein